MSSTEDDIREVYESEIYQKSKLVESKFGPGAFYCGFSGFQIERHPCFDIISKDHYPVRRKK